MIITNTNIKGLLIIEPEVFSDERGYFFESYNEEKYKEFLTGISFIQDNEAKSGYGVLRGLHFQKGDFAQAKLVRVIKGAVLDIAVDIRKDSITFGQHFSIELNELNRKQFFIPKGFAHGYIVLQDETIFHYKCDNYYAPHSESGIIYNDPDLNIDWRINPKDFIISNKDIMNKSFKDIIPFENF